jgi:hypothetical protein
VAKPNFKLSKRMVSARFWTNPELAKLAKQSKIPNLKLTMIGLWSFADEAGIFEWQPDIVAAMIYTLDTEEDRASVEPAMNAMVEAGFLKKIQVGKDWYGCWPNWGEHNSFRKNDSRYPEVAAALNYPHEGSSTLKKPRTASEAELETELEVEVKEGESESEKQPTASGQDGTNPQTDDVSALCDLISSYSGNAVKPDWAKYAKAILKVVPLEKLRPLLVWMYEDSDFWGQRTFNTKNLFDHLQEGNLLRKYNAVKKLRKAQAAKADKPSAPGAHGNFSGMEL